MTCVTPGRCLILRPICGSLLSCLLEYAQIRGVAVFFQHLKTMDSMWGRPGAGAPLGRQHADFAKKQKRKYQVVLDD